MKVRREQLSSGQCRILGSDKQCSREGALLHVIQNRELAVENDINITNEMV